MDLDPRRQRVGCTAACRPGDVVEGSRGIDTHALDQHAPSHPGRCVVLINLKRDVRPRCICQLGAMRGAKRHDPMTQRVIDRENKRLSSDDDGNATELVPIEKLEALVFGDFFKIGVQFRFIHGVPSYSSPEARRSPA
jgi:hypothetical protein